MRVLRYMTVRESKRTFLLKSFFEMIADSGDVQDHPLYDTTTIIEGRKLYPPSGAR